MKAHVILASSFCILLFTLGCKKNNIQPEPIILIEMDRAELILERNVVVGERLVVHVDGKKADPSDFVWSSDDSTIVSVREDGAIWGIWSGTTTVRAKSKNKIGEAQSRVTVLDNNAYKFRLVLKDKGQSFFSLSNPEQFLSPKSIKRRQKYNISIDERDLPISTDYIKDIEAVGGRIVAKSKWLNTVTVHCSDGALREKYRQFPFVKEVIVVWENENTTYNFTLVRERLAGTPKITDTEGSLQQEHYGSAWQNITLNKGNKLHERGFKGRGMAIAVIDAGFSGLTKNSHFANSSVQEIKSFNYDVPDPVNALDDNHGIEVSSVMAVNQPGVFVGTAPEADYWLFTTEYRKTEFPVEEDYLIAALEYADSVGVDLANISLGYDQFSIFGYSGYGSEDMDGTTALLTRAVNVASDKGILIVTSAGNFARWVSTPADSPKILAVGAVSASRDITSFSSFGITADGRIKPDVVALGQTLATVQADNGILNNRFGTSFSSPIICGLAACLWQAYPTLTNKDIMDVIIKSSDRATNPVLPYGHGIPDMEKAMEIAGKMID